MGPVGLGILAQLFNFISLAANTINLGVPLGLSAVIPSLSKENSDISNSKIRSYIEYFLLIAAVISAVITFIFLLFSDFFLNLLVDNVQYKTVFIIMILAIPFLVLYSVIESILRGIAKITVIVKITVTSSIISIIFLLPLIYYLSIDGAAIYIVILSMLPLAIFSIRFKNEFAKFFTAAKKSLLSSEKNVIYKLGIVSVVSTLLHQGAVILLRRMIITNLGLESNGIYQSVLSVSLNAFSIVYIFLTNYTLPKLSGLANNEEIKSELNVNLRLLIFILIPAVIILFTYREYLILILFSKSFLSATNLIGFQLIGDIFRAFAALFGLWLIPKMKIKQLITIDISFNIVFIMLPFVLLNYFNFGLTVIPLCYMIAFFVHFILYLIYSRFEIAFRFTNTTMKNLYLSCGAVLITFISSLLVPGYSLILNALILLIWAFLVIDRNEKKLLIEKIMKR